MKRLTALLVATMLVTSPALAQERTATYCDSYAKAKSGHSSANQNAGRGLVGGAVVGGIVNGSTGARRGGVTGAVIGGISGSNIDQQRYNQLYHHCLSGNPL